MDLSFDIMNMEGDHIMVALSYYDNETVSNFSADPQTLTLVFYDVTLVRRAGAGYVGYKMLFAVSDVLAKFMEENENAVLCFYCDANSDVRRNHKKMLSQEYRSRLFSQMFEMYVKSRNLDGFINHRVELADAENPDDRQYAHFICRKEHEDAVIAMGQMLIQK